MIDTNLKTIPQTESLRERGDRGENSVYWIVRLDGFTGLRIERAEKPYSRMRCTSTQAS